MNRSRLRSIVRALCILVLAVAGAGFLQAEPVQADGDCVKKCVKGPFGFALCNAGTKFKNCWQTPIPGVCKVQYCNGWDEEEYEVEAEEEHVRVVDTGPTRTLFHGTTAHGSQSLTCLNDAQACALKEGSYYDAKGPIGRLLDGKARATASSLRMGIIGLGVGALADYCRPGDSVWFFEVDPIIKRVADSMFSHLRLARDRCGSVEVILGDGRRRVREEPTGSLDVLVIDAFSSDSIPTHLLTLEAFREARAVLATGRGLIAVHISNRYVDLTGLIASSAESLGMVPTAFTDYGSEHRLPSKWVVVGEAHDQARLPLMRYIDDGEGIRGTRARPGARWTDDRRSLLPLYF